MRIFLSPPWTGAAERRAVGRAFASGYVAPCGPMVDEFERMLARLAGRRFAVAVSSATAALDLLMAEFGVDGGWTVVAPTLTFVATVGPAAHRGAELVFVDCDASGRVDMKLLDEALRDAAATGRRVMYIGVDLYGRCCDHPAISEICRERGAVFVNDAAEAVGATWRGVPSGRAGVAAVYSFNGNKIVTTSGGGAILTDDEGIASRARLRSQQSREPFPWYQHEEVGYNYRLSNISAAIGIAQLSRLPRILERRGRTAAFYAARTRVLPAVEGENHWLTVALAPSSAARDAMLARFAADDMEARHVWKPMHLQPVFRGCRVYGGAVAERLFERGVCLPSGSGMSRRDLERAAAAIAGNGRGAAGRVCRTRMKKK